MRTTRDRIKWLVMFLVPLASFVDAYSRDGRNIGNAASAYSIDFPPYQASRQYSPYHEQHQPFREQSFRQDQYTNFRQQPFRVQQPSQSSFRDQSLLRDYSLLKDQASFYRDRPTYKVDPSTFKGHSGVDGSMFAGRENFRQPSSYEDQRSFGDKLPFTEQSYGDSMPYHGVPSFDEQSVYKSGPRDQQTYSDEERPYSSLQSYREDSYEKPMDSYREREHQSRPPFGVTSSYLNFENRDIEFSSTPMASPYASSMQVNADASTPSSTASTATHKPLLLTTVSPTASAITKVHSPVTLEPKIAASATPTQATSRPSALPSTTAESPFVTSTPYTSTVASISAAPKEPSSLNHEAKTLTGVTSLPLMVNRQPVTSLDGNIQYQTPKFPIEISPATFYYPSDLKANLQSPMLSYIFPPDHSKQFLKTNFPNAMLTYLMSDNSKDSHKANIQGQVLNYILPEDTKTTLKSSMQAPLLNYVLPEEPKRALSFQTTPRAETLNYLSLPLADRSKFTMPSIQISPLSALSRPLQTINYMGTTLPRMSFVNPQASASTALPLGSGISTLSGGISSALTASLPSALPASMSAGISTGIPGGISMSIPASIPAVNFDQSFQPIGHMRQFGDTNSSPFDAGLQLQLGGFGGLDYTLQQRNPASRPIQLGIAKVGLRLPELPRAHVSPFAKIGLAQQLW